MSCPPNSERQRADAAAPGRLLPEGRLPASASAAEADVCDQLHGDGPRHRRASHLPALQGTADQSRLPAAATGKEWTPDTGLVDKPFFVCMCHDEPKNDLYLPANPHLKCLPGTQRSEDLCLKRKNIIIIETL